MKRSRSPDSPPQPSITTTNSKNNNNNSSSNNNDNNNHNNNDDVNVNNSYNNHNSNNNNNNPDLDVTAEQYVQQALLKEGIICNNISSINDITTNPAVTESSALDTMQKLCPLLHAGVVKNACSNASCEGSWITYLFKHIYGAKLSITSKHYPSSFKHLHSYHTFILATPRETVFVSSKVHPDSAALMEKLCSAVSNGKLSPCVVKVALLAGVRCWGTKETEPTIQKYFDMDGICSNRLAMCIHFGSPGFYFNELLTYLTKQLQPPKFDQPLQVLLGSDQAAAIIEAISKSSGYRVLSKEEYLPVDHTLRADWENLELPDSWITSALCYNSLCMEGRSFQNLVVTDTVKEVKKCDGYEKLAVIGGESGSGKTCALFAAGVRVALHIVATLSEMLDGFRPPKPSDTGPGYKDEFDQRMVAHVRSYVCRVARYALLTTPGNVTHPPSVVLHLDEAGVLYSKGGGCQDLAKIDKIRSLIRTHERLLNNKKVQVQKAALEQEELDQLSLEERLEAVAAVMHIRVVLAGTGLEELHSGATGSIADRYALVTAGPPRNSTLRDLVEAHFPAEYGVVQTLYAQPPFRNIVATNNRLLSLVLLRLQSMLAPLKAELAPKGDTFVPHGIELPNLTEPISSVLPSACFGAAMAFVEANGLRDVPSAKRQQLLQRAHVAHLKRAVVVMGSLDTYNVVRNGLTNAGFTPVHYDENKLILQQPPEVQSLVEAAALGMYSTTKTVTKLGTHGGMYIPAGDESKEGDVVMVPNDKPPLTMSVGHRTLPRLLNKTLFGDGGPQNFEDVMTTLLSEGLNALGLMDGGCTYRTLLAAVCGAGYGLPAAPVSPWTDPPFEHLRFTRAVLVPLPCRLSVTKGRPLAALRRELVLSCARALAARLNKQLVGRRRAYPNADTKQLQKGVETLERAIVGATSSAPSDTRQLPSLDEVAHYCCCSPDALANANSAIDRTSPLSEEAVVVLPTPNCQVSGKDLAACLGLQVGELFVSSKKGNAPIAATTIVKKSVHVCATSLRRVAWLRQVENLISGVMFVVVPAPQSPSPDTVLLCIGTGKSHGYLGAIQLKCFEENDLTYFIINEELAKMGLPPIPHQKNQQQSHQVAADEILGEDEEDIEDIVEEEEAEMKKQRAAKSAFEVRGMMESVATGTGPRVSLSDAFFGVLKGSSLKGFSYSKMETYRMHCYAREDLQLPGVKTGE